MQLPARAWSQDWADLFHGQTDPSSEGKQFFHTSWYIFFYNIFFLFFPSISGEKWEKMPERRTKNSLNRAKKKPFYCRWVYIYIYKYPSLRFVGSNIQQSPTIAGSLQIEQSPIIAGSPQIEQSPTVAISPPIYFCLYSKVHLWLHRCKYIFHYSRV